MPLMDVSDEENEEVIQPVKAATQTVPASEEDEEDCDFDDIDEETSISKAQQSAAAAPQAAEPSKPESNNEAEVEDDGIRTSMGERPKVAHVAGEAASMAPSALQEEREARENSARDDGYGSETLTDDDPDVVRDEEEYSKARPIMRELGKSKPCYRAPFSSCVHMPFVTETSEPIKSYSMSAERYCEQVGKNQDTTKDIIQAMTPAKLAQQVCVFKVLNTKGATTNSLRRYAAFIRVTVTDFEEGSAGLSETLSDGQALYQLHPQEFSKLFKGEHGLKLPRSLVPTSKAVEYVRLVPKAEAETKPEGWIVCPSIGDGKSGKRSRADKDKAPKKQKTAEPVEVLETTALTDAPATEPAAPEAASIAMPASVYSNYAFVPGGASTGAAPAPSPVPKPAPAPVEAPAPAPVARAPVQNGGSGGNDFDLRQETYGFNLAGRLSWPTVGPSFDFDPSYSTLEVTFKVTRK
jgi:hypothetical protein